MNDEADDGRPSKSARKRAAHDAQRLGERLIGMSDAELEPLALPEPLLEAIREARRITSRAAGVRQRQYIGRLMREIDCGAIVAALAARAQAAALASERFRRVEAWRDRLVREGPEALAALAQIAPVAAEARWQMLVVRARDPQAPAAARTAAARELFRELRALLAPPQPSG